MPMRSLYSGRESKGCPMTDDTKWASVLWRNWPMHNLLAHPASEIAYWLTRPFGRGIAERVSSAIHDVTLPVEKPR